MATSTPLFNALASAKFTHKYEVVWAELPGGEFNTKTKAWLKQLGKIIGGPSSKERKALAQEFLQFLYVYKQMLEKLTQGTHSPEPALVLQKMNDFNAEYKRQFGGLLDMPILRLPSELASVADKMAVNAVRRDLIVRKKQLLKFWMDGLRNGSEYMEDVSLRCSTWATTSRQGAPFPRRAVQGPHQDQVRRSAPVAADQRQDRDRPHARR